MERLLFNMDDNKKNELKEIKQSYAKDTESRDRNHTGVAWDRSVIIFGISIRRCRQ